MEQIRYNLLNSFLPQDLLESFNRMNSTARQYTMNRICGFNKRESLIAVGTNAKDEKSISSIIQKMEERNPTINQVVEYCLSHDVQKELLDTNSKFNKVVDEKAKEVMQPNADLKMQQLNNITQTPNVLSPDKAQSIQFYRDVIKGSIQTTKTICTYDAQGNLLGKRVEKINDVNVKMQAREKLDRILGLNALQQLGQVTLGSISVNIVDASKKEEPRQVDVQDDAKVLDDEEIVINEVVEEKKPEVKEEKLPLYYTDENGNRRRRPSWQRTIKQD